MLFLFLLLLEANTAHGDVRASNCTIEEQQNALLDLYSAWGGPSWFIRRGWLNTSMACEDSGIQLPAHCCWYGIKCCLSRTCSRTQKADLDRCDCSEPGLVWAIELDSNSMEGNFSSFDHNAFACELYGLRVGNNKLYGPIGQDFTLYKRIGYAELQENYLQGPLPYGLGTVFTLWSFNLARNMLEGSLPMDICGENTRLFLLSVENNKFTGLLDLSKCVQLGYFFAEGNNFDAAFPWGMPTLPALRSLKMGQNSLKGMLPKENFMEHLPNLEELNLLQNQLAGPLPNATLYSLQQISLADNRFTGPIPLTWWRMARPGLPVYLQTNYLSCCGTKPLPAAELTFAKSIQRIDEVYQGVNYSAPRLPPFLELTDILVPVRVSPRQSFKATGLRCPELKASKQMDFEPTPGQPTNILQWFLDPPYYMFEGCVCEEELQLFNLTRPGRLPYFECHPPLEPSNESWEEAYPWAIVIIVVVGCALLITLLLGLYLYKGTEVVQKLNNLKKRMHGLPTSGPFTAVVTDIQGWTELCSQYPELSWKVLSIHNSILRRARWNNFGSTHETEGDSFTMVFYDAKDAVAFCLQAQQMLGMQQWPCHKELHSEEHSTSLLSSYASPVGSQSLKKSCSTNSLMMVNPLSSSKLHHNSDQEGTASMDIRVRMGLASGFLCPGESLHAHPAIAFAKEVSDAAVGGQILMESSTYNAVKDSLEVLGTVDSQGMHLDRLRMRRIFNWSACFLFGCIAPAAAANDDAVVLDMGTYTKPRLDQERKQAQTPARDSTGRPPKSRLFARVSSMNGTAGAARRALRPDELQLYQVLPADGAERAKSWGSKLRTNAPLKDSLSKGYFDAPGTLAAPLGISKGSAMASLPLVTTVFASVEHAWSLSSRDTRQVEHGLLTCARNCLDLEQVQGDGYLCRSFGNLRLMLVFSRPEAALVWSCAMQESMMAQTWPRAALKEPYPEMHDQHGQLIFRGPRLKIGISQGHPDSIQPDHLGRADYHGDCVNSAARFEAGAAQGGMVVCEHEVAMRAVEAWAAMQTCLDTEKAHESPQQISRSWSASQSANSSNGKQHTSQNGRPQKDPTLFRVPAALSSSPPNDVHLIAPANSRASPCSEPLYLLPPPLEVALAHCGMQDDSRSSNQQVRGSIHVYLLGLFRFKGIANPKSMVYVLQDKLSARAEKFVHKSANPSLATLVPQQQPEGVTKSTFLVPLPVIEAEVASQREQGVRTANVRFELDSRNDSNRLMTLSDASWKGTSVHSQDVVPSSYGAQP